MEVGAGNQIGRLDSSSGSSAVECAFFFLTSLFLGLIGDNAGPLSYSDKSPPEKTEKGQGKNSHPFYCHGVKMFDTKVHITLQDPGGF